MQAYAGFSRTARLIGIQSKYHWKTGKTSGRMVIEP